MLHAAQGVIQRRAPVSQRNVPVARSCGRIDDVPADDEDGAWLWAPPDKQPTEPPVVTKLARLPTGKLTWENTERLFLRLLERQGEVQWAKLYGTRGQDQEGIDAYARLTLDAEDSTKPSSSAELSARRTSQQRPYAVLQSRRVQSLSPSDITGAIDDFLAGSWEPETCTFYYATSYDLTDKRLDAALRQAAERLKQVGITFVPWGAEDVSAMLRLEPELVDDFFGRSWVEHFCGAHALSALRTRLTFRELRDLRQQLAVLYTAVFDSQNAIRRPSDGSGSTGTLRPLVPVDQFVIVDVAPRAAAPLGDVGWLAQGGLAVEAVGSMSSSSTRSSGVAGGLPGDLAITADGGAFGATTAASGSGEDQIVNASSLGRPRRSLRSIRSLLDLDSSPAKDSAFREAADLWLSGGSRNLLVGDPGSGKSSLLRFVASDLLSSAPQSRALQQQHGGRLPVWLPFGFLCRHLDEGQGNSLATAIRTWLDSRSAGPLWPLVERALEDDRLLLLIDGIDEWTSREAANIALDAIETFLGRTDAAAFLSSRPYAVARLASALSWRRADLATLDDSQLRLIATQYLTPNNGFLMRRGHSATMALRLRMTAKKPNLMTGFTIPHGKDQTWSRSWLSSRWFRSSRC